MAKHTSALDTPLREQLDRLASFEEVGAPVISLYLDMTPDQHGRDNANAFVRKVFGERGRSLTGSARASFDRDAERIQGYLASDVRESANGLAIFACSAAGLFTALQLDAPIVQHWLFIAAVPHLYPLARLTDQYPRYAALLVDTNSARLFVFGLGAAEHTERIQNDKTRKTSVGGWSQARYQRHVSNIHLLHMKEVTDLLERVVQEEGITQIIVACHEVARPALMEQFPKHLVEKVVDVLRLDIRTPEHEILAATLAALRDKDADTDAGQVQRMLDGWKSNGLGSAGANETMQALDRGQVEELLITSTPGLLRSREADTAPSAQPLTLETTSPEGVADLQQRDLGDALVAKAHRTGARVRFIEDPELLANVGGVGALLRFRI